MANSVLFFNGAVSNSCDGLIAIMAIETKQDATSHLAVTLRAFLNEQELSKKEAYGEDLIARFLGKTP